MTRACRTPTRTVVLHVSPGTAVGGAPGYGAIAARSSSLSMPVNLVDASRLALPVDPEELRRRPSLSRSVESPTRGYETSTAHMRCRLVRGMISISCSLGRPSPGSGDVLPGCAIDPAEQFGYRGRRRKRDGRNKSGLAITGIYGGVEWDILDRGRRVGPDSGFGKHLA